MKKFLLSFLLVLSGCATHVAAPGENWPAAPDTLLDPVPNLTVLPEGDSKLTDLLSNVNQNYSAYYLLKNKFELWQQWYNQQKQIYKQSQ